MKRLIPILFLTACGGSGSNQPPTRPTLPPSCEAFIAVAQDCINEQTGYAKAELQTQLKSTIDAWERLMYDNPTKKTDLDYGCELSMQKGLDYYCTGVPQ